MADKKISDLAAATVFALADQFERNNAGGGPSVRETRSQLLNGVLSFSLRDTSAAFNVTLAAASNTALTDNRVLTLNVQNVAHTINFGATAGTITFPDAATLTVARSDAAQTFTGVQAFTSPAITTSLTTPSTTFALANDTATTINFAGAATTLNVGAGAASSAAFNFTTGIALNTAAITTNQTTVTALAGATTLLTLGGTGASAVLAIPGTLDASGTTGALTVAGGAYIAKALNVVGAITATAASPQLTLGVLNTTSGGIKFFGSTSGNVTLAPNVAAGASVTVTLPATSVTLNAAGDLTGTTLAAGVVTSSLTTVGVLNAGSITNGFGSIDVGADAITGGAISGTSFVAGGVTLTAFAGATTLLTLGPSNATGVVAIPGTKASTVSTDGAFTVGGGIGVAGNSNFGGALGVVGAVTISGNVSLTIGTNALSGLTVVDQPVQTGASRGCNYMVRYSTAGSVAGNWAIGANILAADGSFELFNGTGATQFSITPAGAVTIPGTTVNMTTSGTTLIVGVGADNGTVSAGVFTDRTKAFEGDALGLLKAIKVKNGHIDHDTLPEFARAKVKRGIKDYVVQNRDGVMHASLETVGEEEVEERDLGAMISMLTVAVNQLHQRVVTLEH